jgi:probable rRNA maturation factor
MISLQVKRNVKLPVDKAVLLHAAQLTLDLENIAGGASLSVVVSDDMFLRKLNHQYRNIDAATDVLSFPASETDPDINALYLGDVIISLPRAEVQASEGSQPVKDELLLLVVHGILHLLGYDHLKRADKKKMQEAQDRILAELGLCLESKL